MTKHYRIWLKTILVLLTLSGCAHEQILDHVAYGDKGILGATAVHTLFTSIPPVHYSKDEWDALRLGMICMAPQDISEIQQSVDDLCLRWPCDYQTMQAIASLKEALQRFK
jgi:hypothetical protein